VQDAIIYIDPDNPVNLQHQIRQKIVDGIVNGAFPPGMKLPSSRKLAQQLEVARNTVVASYQQLIADGYLISRQRSGIFVSEEILKTRVGAGGTTLGVRRTNTTPWLRDLYSQRAIGRPAHDIPNWSHYCCPSHPPSRTRSQLGR